jgi:uncharacterized membrane protein
MMTFISLALGAVGWGRKLATGAYGNAMLYTVGAVILSVLVAVFIPISRHQKEKHDQRIAAEARHQCEAEEQAERLAAENAAIKQASARKDQILSEREAALSFASRAIAEREDELARLRNELSKAEDSGRVVFGADDEWLRRRSGAAAPVPHRR